MNIEDFRLTEDKRRKIVEEDWVALVSPYIDGLNTIEAEEKLKELPDVFEMIANTATDKAMREFVRGLNAIGFIQDTQAFITALAAYVREIEELVTKGVIE